MMNSVRSLKREKARMVSAVGKERKRKCSRERQGKSEWAMDEDRGIKHCVCAFSGYTDICESSQDLFTF